MLLTNCGQGFVAEDLMSLGNITNNTNNTSNTDNSGSGSSVTFNQAPGQSCEDALLNVYKNTYHPFLVKNCNSCHIPGGSGSGAFAVDDAATSYPIFSSKGAPLIDTQSTGGHKPPYTGSHQQSTIAEISAYWSKAKTSYQECVTNSGGTTDTTYLTKSKPLIVASDLADTFVAMEWDLETLGTPKVPLIAKIEIRKSALYGSVIGYEFRNPSLRLKDNAKTPYLVQGLSLAINGKLQTEITTYRYITATINTKADINIAPNLGYAQAIMSVAKDDGIALEFSVLKSTTGKIVAAPTPTPTPSPTPIGRVTYLDLITPGGVILNRCNVCHSSAKNTSLDLFAYQTAKAGADKIKARINDPTNPMPPKGLLPQNERDILEAWINGGTPYE